MTENENLLLRDGEVSNKDCNSDVLATMVHNPPEERANEASDNFESLTYVSSRGFFFQ